MSKSLENKKVKAYRKRLQSERRINEESKNAPITAAERMRRMRQRRQVEASTSRADAATPDASSQANGNLHFFGNVLQISQHCQK
jgi:hypothetical protein